MPSRLPLQTFYQGRILNFGHRGAKHDAPQNTIAAYELAANYGADGVEMDVQLTADGVVIGIHDYVVDDTTDGSGKVEDLTLAEIKALDAGSYFDARFAGERIPTLSEAFEAVGDRLLFNIELKGITPKYDGLEAALVEIIERHNMASRVIVSSFNPLRLRRLRKIAPNIPIGFLHRPDLPLHQRWGWLMWGYPREADHPMESTVTPEYMARMRRHHWRVNAWVANDLDRMKFLRDIGVDMIITDRPDVLRAVLQGER